LTREIPGIHHVTAIAGDPQGNIDFYTEVLGLRLVKLTVNYDDPTTYHLYFGDAEGHPGTILTFFPWPGAPRGQRGTGQVVAVSFSAPEKSVEYWSRRLQSHNIPFKGPVARFGEQVVSFSDPDGLALELVFNRDEGSHSNWESGPVPSELAIRRFSGVTLAERQLEISKNLLTDTMQFHLIGQEGERSRYQIHHGSLGVVDILQQPSVPRGFVSVGTVHHVAWRTPNDDEQKSWREDLIKTGLHVTPVIDRKYFHSIYFREPGGVLFEVATDPPGFTIDQPLEELGTRLVLPDWLEPERKELEASLPREELPKPVPAH
jgi:glyoxalase family protein